MRYKFSGDDIIPFIGLVLVVLLFVYCIVSAALPDCLPLEHAYRLVFVSFNSDIYCTDCGELLYDVDFCICGERLTGDYCSSCGTLRGGN